MIERKVDIGKDFSSRLIYRNSAQSDNKDTAEVFRKRFLSCLDNQKKWESNEYSVALDFLGVEKISPGFANEAFAYFTKYAHNAKEVLERIKLENIDSVHYDIILEEIKSGF